MFGSDSAPGYARKIMAKPTDPVAALTALVSERTKLEVLYRQRREAEEKAHAEQLAKLDARISALSKKLRGRTSPSTVSEEGRPDAYSRLLQEDSTAPAEDSVEPEPEFTPSLLAVLKAIHTVGNEASLKEITKVLGIDPSAASVRISRAKQVGLVARVRSGVYTLTPLGAAALVHDE